METFYSVTLHGKPSGKVSVKRQGLYYCIACRCNPETADMYRLMVACSEKKESLGILVPSEGSFVLNTRIPVKRIGEGDMQFYLVSPKTVSTETFVPISPEEPFAYISRLKESFLVLQDGQPGIQISKTKE